MFQWLRSGNRLTSVVLLALLTWFVIVPVVLTLLASVRPSGLAVSTGLTLKHYVATYLTAEYWLLFRNTLVFAAGSTFVAIAIGGGVAFLTERTDLPGAGLIRAAMILPMAMPPILLAIGWVLLASPRTGFLNSIFSGLTGLSVAPLNIYSLTGMVFVGALSVAPSAYLVLAPAFRTMDSSLEDAAYLSGASTWKVATRIFLPLMYPAIMASAIFLFIVGFLVFDIPGALGLPVGINVLSSQVVYLVTDAPSGIAPYGQVSAMVVMILALLILLAVVYQRTIRNQNQFVTMTGKNWRPRTISLGQWRWAGVMLAWGYFLFAAVLPFLMLLWISLMPYQVPVSFGAFKLMTLRNHIAFFSGHSTFDATINSLIIASVSASVVTLLAAVIAFAVVRLKVPARGLIDMLAFLPIAIAGTLIGIGLIQTYIAVEFIPIYGTIWIIVIAYSTTYLSYGSRGTQVALMQVHADLTDAAYLSGASRFIAFVKVLVPLILPSMLAIWIWVFAHALRELTSAMMLRGVGNTTLPVLLYDYWSTGQPNKAAAAGVWLIFIMVIGVVIWQLVSMRKPKL